MERAQEPPERRQENPFTKYIAACRELEPHPSEAELRRLAALERAARRAWGDPFARYRRRR